MAFSEVMAQGDDRMPATLVHGDSAAQERAAFVSANYFSFLGVALLAAASLLAAYIPARRAARIDPMVALRYE